MSAFEVHGAGDRQDRCSEDTVRRRFRDDPKVGRVGRGETRNKRPRFRLFISESSFVRWWDELKANGR